MSESVKIPVSYGINNHTYAEVTPDLARQIVALARDASEEQQFPPEARIAPAKLILNPSSTMHMAQSIDTTRQIGPGIVDARHSVNDHDCKKGAAHQSEMEKAHGDDAAVEALRELTFIEGENRPYALMSWKGDEREHAACAILAAIHAGKVKGVWCDDYNLTLKLSAQELEISALRVESSNHAADAEAVRRERDRALERVAELEKELATAVDGRAVHLKSHNEAVAERDRALDDLAAERERRALVESERDSANRIAANRTDDAGRFRVMADAARADLAAERGKHAESRALWRDTMVERTAERDAACADVERLKARKVKIGTITNPSYYSDSQAIAFHTGVQACADAIRAAGIEVDCE